jgi:hypothetical protein
VRINGVDVSTTNTAAHTADTPQLLLEHHLKELRLPTILREYDKVARQCAVEQVDYQHYLLRITELELLDRERRATDRRIRKAKFPVIKTMDSFDFLAIPSLNKTLVLERARCEFLARRENVLLFGNSGTGKTHIALALGLHPTDEDLSVGTSWSGGLPAWPPCALYHHCRSGRRTDRGPRREEVAPLPAGVPGKRSLLAGVGKADRQL